MQDTSFLLLPALEHYFVDLPQSNTTGYNQFFDRVASTLPATSGMTYTELLDLDIRFVLNSTQTFAMNQSIDNLILLKPNEPDGNWCDINMALDMVEYLLISTLV